MKKNGWKRIDRAVINTAKRLIPEYKGENQNELIIAISMKCPKAGHYNDVMRAISIARNEIANGGKICRPRIKKEQTKKIKEVKNIRWTYAVA
ncbi:MAG: hypothetical protein U9M94_04095 [Patescibacteria group bacterium]|nr:hypothetical protein [Patescibacteria group bacterium]